MGWDFSTEPEFQEKLDWMKEFVRDECEPLDLAFAHQTFKPMSAELRSIIKPLQQQVRDQGLWACHLDQELGGQGYGQLKLALMNEILGRSAWASIVFGTQAPDTGNAEILAAYGTEEQKARYLKPLLEGDIYSCYSMTEPHAGSDPMQFKCRAWREGDEWVIDGEKFFSSNLRSAAFVIVMVVTNPDATPYERMSMFLVPTETPGIEFVHDVGLMWEPIGQGLHAHVRYNKVRVPADALLGREGGAFEIAQRRLGGGRIHHAMRTVGMCNRAFEMMCERVLSRETQGSVLAEKQMVQDAIAQSFIQIAQFRLLVLYTAWLIEQSSTRDARTYIAACKVEAERVLHDVVFRAMRIHGALGMSNLMPFGRMWALAPMMGIMDGPTEVHKVTVARRVLKGFKPSEGIWPSEFLPHKIEEARKKFGEILEHEVGNL
jgi:acyl-CoA dehydrogenase